MRLWIRFTRQARAEPGGSGVSQEIDGSDAEEDGTSDRLRDRSPAGHGDDQAGSATRTGMTRSVFSWYSS